MWYQHYLELLDPHWNPLYLVSDPDGILAHAELNAALLKRGQHLVPVSDPLELRLHYEREWRIHPPSERRPQIFVYSGVPPYDLLLQAKYLELSYEKVFPDLNPQILKQMDAQELQTLWQTEKLENRQALLQAHLSQKQAEDQYLQAFRQKCEDVEKNCPGGSASWQAWLDFAWTWAGFKRAYTELPFPLRQQFSSSWQSACNHTDANYVTWLKQHWNSLLTLPPSPVLVHQIPHFLARWKNKNRQSVALLILDGLALDQWLLLEEKLQQHLQVSIQRRAIFAWLPSLTGISRRSIFNGLMPRQHTGGAEALAKESSEWQAFWQGRGEKQVYYAKNFQATQLQALTCELDSRMNPVLGLVINAVDDMMHGNTLGNAGLYAQLRTWLDQGHWLDLISSLLDRGYAIFISADHGNTEAQGLGHLPDGVMAESAGERVRIYSSLLLREQACQKYPNLFPLDSAGLPPDYYPVYAPNRMAFAHQNQLLVAHGGPSLEETVVPWIHLSRSQP